MDNLEKLAISDVSISVKPNIPLNQDFRFRKCYKFLTPEEIASEELDNEIIDEIPFQLKLCSVAFLYPQIMT